MGMGLLGGAEVNGAVLGRAHVGAYRRRVLPGAGLQPVQVPKNEQERTGKHQAC